ncbi:MAG: hypothetical protein GX567_11850 [Clostridia bacterium]|nr:hypothetical protein [Clostridia bacterium]
MFQKAFQYVGEYKAYTYRAICYILVGIAHRLNTIANADNILVIEDGRIVQNGTHDELMQSVGVYQNFVNARKTMKGWNA